jgi:hypothetical protein
MDLYSACDARIMVGTLVENGRIRGSFRQTFLGYWVAEALIWDWLMEEMTCSTHSDTIVD